MGANGTFAYVISHTAVLCAATRNAAAIHPMMMSIHTSTANRAVDRMDTAMPRIVRPSPSDTVEDTEGHMPRIKTGPSSDTADDTEDTEGHMPRIGRGAPSDTVEDTEGHARNRP